MNDIKTFNLKMENTEEKLFFKNNNVTVTQSRFVSGGKTYPMSNILSVKKCLIRKPSVTPILYIVVGIIFLIFSLDLFFRITGGICVIIGVLWLFSGKHKFSVRINTNEGKEDSFISTDEELIGKIVYAVSEAIFYRV